MASSLAISPAEIMLVTRVRTNNKGNQALSAGWVELLRNAFPGAGLRVFERRPAHLLQYALSDFANARDPFAAFDKVTSQLASQAPGPSFIGPPNQPTAIALDEKIASRPPLAALRQKINVRKWAARAGMYRLAFQQRLAAAQRARLVVVNPAGEFFPSDPNPALYHLLDVHVASKLGCRTAIVNHTLDVKDPTLRKLIPAVYRSLSLVGFRDEKSVPAYTAMGGSLDNVVVAPDLALTTLPPAPQPRRAGTVAVAIHTQDAEVGGVLDQWLAVIEKLRNAGFTPVLVSNEFPSDMPFLLRVQERSGVTIEGQALDFDAYAALLGTFDFVVSSRMHTNILALVAGTPVVPIEGPSFKITALFRELSIPVTVVQPQGTAWTDEVLAQALNMRATRDQVAALVASQMSNVRARIYDTLMPRLRQAAIWA